MTSRAPVQSIVERAGRRAAPLVLCLAFALGGCAGNDGPAPADMVPCETPQCKGICLQDGDCAAGRVCDKPNQKCVECNVDADCANNLVCDTTIHSCVAGCAPGHPCAAGVCDEKNRVCVECLAGADCKDPKKPDCDPTLRRCQECLPTDDRCGHGSYCAAQNPGYACAPGCRTSDDCTPLPDGGIDAGNDASIDLDGGTPMPAANLCDPAAHQCVQCLDDMQCPLGSVCKKGLCGPGCTAQHGCPGNATCCVDQCVDLTADRLHCGACDNACGPGSACCGGACTPDTDVLNCGACGRACTVQNGVPACKNGQCVIAGCGGTMADCNGLYGDGCETDIAVNLDHCGACQNPCSPPNARGACAAAHCAISACIPPFADCDGKVQNGCEIKTSEDPANCGGCGLACAGPSKHVPQPSCAARRCDGACEAGWADCDNDKLTDGCEVQIGADPDNCGACGVVCSAVHGTRSCNGACRIACDPLYDDCDKDVATGCESALTSLANCGACGTLCALPNANPTCLTGQCRILTCLPGYTDCDKTDRTGCEIATDTDVSNCGGCGMACSSVNGTPACAAGRCSIACNAGFADCDRFSGNGCEIDVQTNVLNCGACGRACVLPHVKTATCGAGACRVGACDAGWADCNGNPADGCEVDTTRDALHCGACGAACSTNNAAAACVASACVITCNAGFADCNKQVGDGCEIQTAADFANCGACGAACSNNHIAAPACTAGRCAGTCAAGFSDCNADLRTDGCETQTAADVKNCGACGRACSAANGAPACTAGACAITCNGGFADCNKNVADGCEAPLNDLLNCGACGVACAPANATGSCANGTCAIVVCAAGFADCDGNVANGCEVNLKSDPAHCGACLNAGCSANHVQATCAGGLCAGACAAGFADCNNDKRTDGCETAVATDIGNCGACGRACSAANGTATCTNGACGIQCKALFADCNGNLGDGCETSLATLANCGGCGTACAPANAAGTCQSGTCAIASCNAGFADCDNNPANGCEVPINTNVANCGACGNACNGTNGAATCVNGRCGITCNAGFANCNGSAADGCEVATGTDLNNCGACGRACSRANGTPACNNGNCTIACAAGFANCDGDVTNGCEAGITTDPANCGACSTACSANNVIAPQCASGACVSACAAGFGDCNNNKQADGCEASLATSNGQTCANGAGTIANCGACNYGCSCNHLQTASCTAGQCAGACQTGFANCNNDLRTDGCEISILTDANNCGACGKVCNIPKNGKGVCSGGNCQPSCDMNFSTCNLSYDCNINLLTDVNNCGKCGTVCALVANGLAACAAGKCGIGACLPGFADCDGNAANGCEVNLLSDINNCNTCGRKCAVPSNGVAGCSGGVCGIGSCNAGFADCNASAADGCEVNTKSDVNNCNGCGLKCIAPANSAAVCTNAACGYTCNSGFGDCKNGSLDGCETSIATDATNCGACTQVCSNNHIANPTCGMGLCNGTCSANWGDCNGNKLTDGCERSLTTLADCGGCNVACTRANATPTCATGTCAISSCNAGFANCDNGDANGCEVNTNTDPVNCGACAKACSSNNITNPVCTAGSCTGLCNAGFGDCDGNKQTNGCETDLSTNAANCGACNRTCSNNHIAAPTCGAGSCTGTCDNGFLDCNGNKQTDGCEVNKNQDWTNCGNCGTTCPSKQLCASGACGAPTACANYIDVQTPYSPWVLCAYTANVSAWISAAAVGGGTFHAGQICKQLGFNTVASFGTNCNNICGSCADVGPTSCLAQGTQNYNGMGQTGTDANGPVLQGGVLWKCTP